MIEPKLAADLARLVSSPEIQAAVEWWASRLQNQENVQDSGSPDLDSRVSEIVSMFPRVTLPSPEAIRRFKVTFAVALAMHCFGTWDEDEPKRGCAVRTVGCDYGPDFLLHGALFAAGITNGSLILPIKTTMWINPGSVKVREGYGAPELDIYQR